jgi:hypothetical protein
MLKGNCQSQGATERNQMTLNANLPTAPAIWNTLKITSDARAALRTAIMQNDGWKALRRAHDLSFASMSKSQFLDVCAALHIDAAAIVNSAPATSEPSDPNNGAPKGKDADAPVPTVTLADVEAALPRMTDRDAKFASSVLASARQYGSFTDRQAFFMNRLIHRAMNGNGADKAAMLRAVDASRKADDARAAFAGTSAPAATQSAADGASNTLQKAAAWAQQVVDRDAAIRAAFDQAHGLDKPAQDGAAFDHAALIPDAPVPLSQADLAKFDRLVGCVDPDVSFSALYSTALAAIACAKSLQAELQHAKDNPTTTDHLTKALTAPALDFVPPSWAREFGDYIAIHATIALVGPSGNGKTTGARKLLERAGFNVYEMDCTAETMAQDVIGRTKLRQENGATVSDWTPGPLAKAFNDPKGALLLNEYDALDPRAGMSLQSALEAGSQRRVTAPDSGEQLQSVGPCPIVLTMNTLGHGATVQYAGRNVLDGANRDRVEIITTGYENEKEIIEAHGFTTETATRLAEFATKARNQLSAMNSRELFTNRRLLTGAALMERRGFSLREAMQRAFVNRMAERERHTFETACL